MDDFTLLCVGDIHLGRRPGRLPSDLSTGLDDSALSPAAAWAATVDWALEQDVDAVVLAGDVVESMDDRFEAYGHLERGVGKLVKGGTQVIAVAGNHDVQALPRLADRIEGVALLGRNGVWECLPLVARSGARIRLLGWSFPQQRFDANPLNNVPCDLPDGAPIIGVLHCDVDGGASGYAPVPLRAFLSAPGIAWLLGHVHKPGDLSGPRPVGYLGSLVGLDPGEPGTHGPWLARINDRSIRLEHIPLAPLRWERAAVPVADFTSASDDDLEDDLADRLRAAFRTVHSRISSSLGKTRAVGCRVHFEGRSSLHERIGRCVRNSDLLKQPYEYQGIAYFAEKLTDDARPALDLERLAQGKDPPGLLARRLLVLERGAEDANVLVAAAARSIEEATRGVVDVSPHETRVASNLRELLLRAGYQGLEALLSQQGTGQEDAR